MPELPEVQTVINSIKSDVIDSTIMSCDLHWKRVIYNVSQNDFKNNIINKHIIDVSRKGKYIIFILSQGFMLCHLRMTGSLFIDSNQQSHKHIQANFLLKNRSSKYLHFKDIRKFGGFYYYDDIEIFNKKIGIDPFESIFTLKWFSKNTLLKKRQIKHLLLDQHFICGLGNIYIDESLWASHIHPMTLSCNIPKNKLKQLYHNIIRILSHSIEFHGTSIRDFTYDNLKSGEYKKYINVFNRQGKECYRCRSIIKKIKVAGRGTHICDKCQKFN